jgi:hypothetical protein
MSADASVTAQFDKLPPPSTLAISILALADAIAGQSYSAQAASASGGSPPYHYQSDTFANGTPPPGMSITLDGRLQGTPSSTITSAQTYSFGVCVVDAAATSRCAQAHIVVQPVSAQNGTMGWTISDQCNNGMEVDYKFFDHANNWVWPSPTTHYYVTYGQSGVAVSLKCFAGAQVCLGAESSDGSVYWGVGFSGTSGCTGCCGTCDGQTYPYAFGCSGPSTGSWYAHWNCQGQSQCITVNGGNSGTAGPFASQAACDTWRQTYFFGAVCNQSPT